MPGSTRRADRNPTLATQNGTTKLTATRTQVPPSPCPAAISAPWFTNDRTVPPTRAVGPAVGTVAPRANIATASRGRVQVKSRGAIGSTEAGDDRGGDPLGCVFLHEVVCVGQLDDFAIGEGGPHAGKRPRGIEREVLHAPDQRRVLGS